MKEVRMVAVSRRSFLTVMAGGAAALLAGCGGQNAPARNSNGSASAASRPAAASPAPTSKVTGAYVALSASQMVLPTAKEAGYFGKYGLDFDLKYIGGSTTAIAAMVAGDVQILNLGGTTVVNAVAGGAELAIVGIFLNKIIFRIMAAPEIKSIADLKGKTVAMTKAGSTDFLAWQLIKASQGWSDADLKLVPANDTQGEVSMLQSRNALAVAVTPPNDVLAERAGAHLLTTIDEEGEKNTLVTTRKFAAEHRPEILATLKAGIEAAARLKSDPAFAKVVMTKYLKESDQRFLDSGYEALAPLWEEKPYPNVPSFSMVVDEAALQNPKAKGLPTTDLLDASFVRELDDSGFIKSIYGH